MMRSRLRVLFLVSAMALASGAALAADNRYLNAYVLARGGDYPAAVEIWESLATSGDVRSQNTLAALYAEGEYVEPDMERAFHWWSRAAEAGDRKAQLRIARMYEIGAGTEPDAALAFEWMSRAARAGEVPAQFKLAEYYYDGSGVARDPLESQFWFFVGVMSGGVPETSVALKLEKELTDEQIMAQRERADTWLEWN